MDEHEEKLRIDVTWTSENKENMCTAYIALEYIANVEILYCKIKHENILNLIKFTTIFLRDDSCLLTSIPSVCSVVHGHLKGRCFREKGIVHETARSDGGSGERDCCQAG